MEIVKPGMNIAPGALVQSRRFYMGWMLDCEVLIGGGSTCKFTSMSHNKDNEAATWIIGPSQSNGTMMVIALPSDTDPKTPVTIKTGADTLSLPKIVCNDKICLAPISFTEAMAKTLNGSPSAEVDFYRAGHASVVNFNINGFGLALQAANATIKQTQDLNEKMKTAGANAAPAPAPAPTTAAVADKPKPKPKAKVKPTSETDN